MTSLNHVAEGAKRHAYGDGPVNGHRDPGSPFGDLPKLPDRAPLRLRALRYLCLSFPEELCPASLMPRVFAPATDIVQALRTLGRVIVERPMTVPRDEARETDVYFRLNPDCIDEAKRLVLAGQAEKTVQ